MSETDIAKFKHEYEPAVSFDVGEDTLALVSRMRVPVEIGQVPTEKLLVGDILRRTCQLGGSACAANGCQAPASYINRTEKLCSDMNLGELVDEISIPREKIFMVSVTADNVGFYDELKSNEAVKTNSVGIKEIVGYNAFFSKDSDDIALGARLADCGFAAIEFDAYDGEKVRGFVHLTRPNMQGESALKFVVEGRPAGSFEYFLSEALKHYGGTLENVKVRIVAAIKKENFPHTFVDEQKLEEQFAGWWGDGLMENASNPTWKSGEQYGPNEVWLPKYREMVMTQVLRSGVAPEQVTTEGMLDPGDLELGHASNHAGANGKMPDGRDAYIVTPKRFVA